MVADGTDKQKEAILNEVTQLDAEAAKGPRVCDGCRAGQAGRPVAARRQCCCGEYFNDNELRSAIF